MKAGALWNMETVVCEKVKVSHNLVAIGAVGLEAHCIMSRAYEKQSPSLSFCCFIVPWFEIGTH